MSGDCNATSGSIKLFQVSTTTTIATVSSAGRISGRPIRRKICSSFRPSMRALSRISLGSEELTYCRTRKMPKMLTPAGSQTAAN
ncbi:hypothetical protein D3C78_1536980 [compost metagenome]